MCYLLCWLVLSLCLCLCLTHSLSLSLSLSLLSHSHLNDRDEEKTWLPEENDDLLLRPSIRGSGTSGSQTFGQAGQFCVIGRRRQHFGRLCSPVSSLLLLLLPPSPLPMLHTWTHSLPISPCQFSTSASIYKVRHLSINPSCQTLHHYISLSLSLSSIFWTIFTLFN